MFEPAGRFLYFLQHPSEYAGVWTLYLTAATFGVVMRQLRIMERQTSLMKTQTETMTAQDELNRALLARRAKLEMYAVGSPSSVKVYCVNNGEKAALSFYWHLVIPYRMPSNNIWNGSGDSIVRSIGTVIQEGGECTHYLGFMNRPLFPTREIPVAQFTTTDPQGNMWWRTISEDGACPVASEPMNRMERRQLEPSSVDG